MSLRNVLKCFVFLFLGLIVFSCSEAEDPNILPTEDLPPKDVDPTNPTDPIVIIEPDVPECGNGKLERGEQCDGEVFKDCESLGFTMGILRCASNCKFDLSGCSYAVCGNGSVEAGEFCDDGSNNGVYGFCKGTCLELGPRCGDGVLQPSREECDGEDLGGKDCVVLGYDEGSLACGLDCKLIKSDCRNKGPDCLSGTKKCAESTHWMCVEGAWVSSVCEGLTPVCWVESGCSAIVCGDGVVSDGEACEADVALTASCEDYDSTIAWEVVGAPSCEGCQLAVGTCVVAKKTYKIWDFSVIGEGDAGGISWFGIERTFLSSLKVWSLKPWGTAVEPNFIDKYIEFSVGNVSDKSAVYLKFKLKQPSASDLKFAIAYYNGNNLVERSAPLTPPTTATEFGPYLINSSTYSDLKIRIAGYGASSSTAGTLHLTNVEILYQ